MKMTHLLWLCCVVQLACGVGETSLVVDDTDGELDVDEADITNGAVSTADRAVVAVAVVSPSGTGLCSGTMLTSRVVVTASHCFGAAGISAALGLMDSFNWSAAARSASAILVALQCSKSTASRKSLA